MDSAHDTTIDDLASRPEPRPERTRFRDEPDSTDSGGTPELFDPFTTLLGAVLMVPNPHWGFEGVTSSDHPGACTHVAASGREATLLKGTDAEHVRHRHAHFVIERTGDNGLTKPTAFELVPRRFRMHRLKLYIPKRRLGQLDGNTLRELRSALERLHPEE